MRNERGSSLIEVLTIVAIIGILAWLAMSKYTETRARGFDAKVVSTLRNVALAEEAHFAQHRTYVGDVANLDGVVVVDDLAIRVVPGNTGSLGSSFRLSASHDAAGHSYTWTSDPAPGEPNLTSQARDTAGSTDL